MSAYLTAGIVRGRQQEIAAAMARSHHHELLDVKRRSRRSVRSLRSRFPRFQTTEPLAAGPTR